MRRFITYLILLTQLMLTAACEKDKPLIDWVEIKAGTFVMGSPENEPGRGNDEMLHKVTLKGFKMSRHEITVAQFKAFVDATGYQTDAEKNTEFRGSFIWMYNSLKTREGVSWRCDERGNIRSESEYDRPVVHVSWNDASEFAGWMGCRLPSEAEWEYACRAGTESAYNTGSSLTPDLANYSRNRSDVIDSVDSDPFIMPASSYKPNGWGLHNMHGNVWEWCDDWYDDYDSEPQTDPKGPATGSRKVDRGGSWYGSVYNCRSANRIPNHTYTRSGNIGFRIVQR